MAKRGSLERLAARVPGFLGYLLPEDRRRADAIVREHGEAQLQRVTSALAALTPSTSREELGEHQELVTQLQKVCAELRLADRSYCAFFADEKLAAETGLDALYAQDERCLEQVDEIAAEVAGAEISLGKLRSSVRRLVFALADRRNAILALCAH